MMKKTKVYNYSSNYFNSCYFHLFVNKAKEDKMVIRVDGWDMEYTISERKLVVEDFEILNSEVP